MSDPVLIYGATGFTGRLVTEAALALGLRPVLAGRDAAAIAVRAESLRLEHRVASVQVPASLDAALAGIRVVVHAAGPFSATAEPMLDACLRSGTHYLDLCAEVPVLEALARRHGEARARGIMVMPGAGFDVVPSDCLAAHVAGRLRTATRLAIGISGLRLATRGSVKTLVEQVSTGVRVRRNGEVVAVEPGTLEREFDYGTGARSSLNVSWGDVVTAYYTTGIADIAVYFEASPSLRALITANRYFAWLLQSPVSQTLLKAQADMLPLGPAADARREARTVIVAEAEDAEGRRAIARLTAPESYTLTGMTASRIAAQVLAEDYEIGFQTPARVYGSDFALTFPGVTREDLQ